MTSVPIKSGSSEPIIGQTSGPRQDGTAARLRRATEDFEAVFIQEMLKAMRTTVPEGGLLDSGQSEEIFTALLDEHVARAAAGRGQGTLAEALYRQFIDRTGS